MGTASAASAPRRLFRGEVALRSAALPLLVLALYLLPAAVVSAQFCSGIDDPEDGGLLCDPDDDGGIGDGGAFDPDDDAGLDEGTVGDGGLSDGDAGLDAGATIGEYDECSCEAEVGDDDGRIHVCTESFEPDVCETFRCTRGTVRGRPCPRSGSRLCCEMRSRGLKSHLYEDCDHPNCESGFRQQCEDYGGSILEGACEAPERPDIIVDEDDDDGGLCSVHAVGRPHGRGLAVAFVGLPLSLLLRRRRGAS